MSDNRPKMQNLMIVQKAAQGSDLSLEDLLALPDETLQVIADEVLTREHAYSWVTPLPRPRGSTKSF